MSFYTAVSLFYCIYLYFYVLNFIPFVPSILRLRPL